MCSGCQTILGDPEGPDTKSWTEPADWEGSGIGMPI